MARIGYFIPEYPGQTHSFFWRELSEMRRLGIEADVVSTRMPAGGSARHDWVSEPSAQALYLVPFSMRSIAFSVIELFNCIVIRERKGALSRVFSELLAAVRTDSVGSAVSRWLRQVGLIFAGASLASLARRRDWNHVHVHSCGNAAQVALYAKHISKVPYSISLHGSLGDYGPNQKPKWRNASFALVITSALMRDVRTELEGSLPPFVGIAPMGVQTQSSKRDRPYEPYSGAGALRLVSCGRLNASKGHDYLVRAVSVLRRAGHDVHLVILGEDDAGGGGYRRHLESVIEAEGVEGSVSLPGSVAEAEVFHQLQNAHLFVLASHAEPLGVAIMEAMSMELPVVATHSGGVPELVDAGVTGILVPPANTTAIVEAIEWLAHAPGIAAEMGRAGRRKVVAEFDSSQSAQTLAELIAAEISSTRELRPI